MGMESFNSSPADNTEKDQKISELKAEQQALWNERSELMKKFELPGDSHNLNLQLEENAEKIRRVEAELKNIGA